MHGSRRAPGELEAEVLGALWSAGCPLTPADVQAELGGGLAYNTVHTILTRLWDKGVVVRDAGGRRGAYLPVQDGVEVAARLMHEALGRESDRAAVLRCFVTGLPAADERALRELFRDG